MHSFFFNTLFFIFQVRSVKRTGTAWIVGRIALPGTMMAGIILATRITGPRSANEAGMGLTVWMVRKIFLLNLQGSGVGSF